MRHPPSFYATISASIAVALAQSSSPLNVVWQSPAAGDVFGPGESIIGKWQAATQVVSPSFRLCVGGANGCGATVWPDVKESAGSYFVSLAVPEVATTSGYYLQMKDDFGKTTSSPIFNLSPTAQNIAQASSGTGSAQSDPDSPASGTPPSNQPSNGAPANPASNQPSTKPSPSSPSLAAPSSSRIPVNPASDASPMVASAHSAPPVAALAVPLSLAGAILLAAGVLALHHQRKLAKERAHDADVLQITSTLGHIGPVFSEELSRRASLASTLFGGTGMRGQGMGMGANMKGNNADLEKALIIGALLSDKRTNVAASVPTTSVYAQPIPAGRTTPSILQRGPEPRQQTRQPFPIPIPPPASRPPSQPPTPLSTPSARSQPPSSRRPTIVQEDPGEDPLAASYLQTLKAINSEHDSMLSDLLPSHLPSPQFEAVPLSPPAALHVREPAPGLHSPPEPERASDMRGVYDAVARALGAIRGA